MTNAILSFGVSGPTQDWTVEMAITEANSTRIINYLMAGTSYGTITEGDTTRPATAEVAAQGFARGIVQRLMDQTTRYERDEAAKEAAEAILPIESV